jgi:hypothetical protein
MGSKITAKRAGIHHADADAVIDEFGLFVDDARARCVWHVRDCQRLVSCDTNASTLGTKVRDEQPALDLVNEPNLPYHTYFR